MEYDQWTPLEDVLQTIDELIKSGKIRGFGLSNETPWGVMKFLQIAEQEGLPKIQSIQNPLQPVESILRSWVG